MRGAAWIALAVLAAACGKKGADPATCRREAGELAALLRSVNHEPGMFYAAGSKLATRTDLPAVQPSYGPLVQIKATQVVMNGQEVPVEAVGERLDAMQRREADRMMRPRHDTDLTLVYFLVDEDARWETVVEVAAAAHAAGYTRPAFGFARPPTPTQAPPRSSVDDELDAIMESDGSNRATEIAELTRKITQSCPAVTEAFGNVAATEESKADFLINSIEPALTACNCSLDLPAFRSVMYRLLYVPDDTAVLRITLDPGGTKLALPPSTPWREVHAKLPAGPVWLE